jgi:prepilin-type N-terminal cleavage/methylation domain-containing protein
MNRINRTSGFTLIELFIVLFIVGIMIFGVVGGLLGKSDGKRVGVITKFTYKGVFVKSYEGELNMGGVRNRTDSEGHNSMVANVWEFSCSNPTVAKQLDDLLGKEVVIKYHQSFAGLSRSTSYDVVSVEEVKK